MDFYKSNIEQLVKSFNVSIDKGLNRLSVLEAQKRFGKNHLRLRHSKNIIKILFNQLSSPLVLLLIIASLVSLYLNQPKDGFILLTIVFLNSFIGFFQEWKSENILSSLQNLVVDKCKVLREGRITEINAEELVPGDIVKLYEGDGVPADIRLINSDGLACNEFILSGESLPSSKDYRFETKQSLQISNIKNCLYMGTTVARGEASGIVYATGHQTEIGKISASSQKITAAKAPVQTEIADVAQKLSLATLVIGAFLFITRMLFNDSASVALIFSVSVAAAMIPEGLPAQISMALALAAGRLAKRNAIVKKIPAAQILGSATVIASDKTGTITKNEMTITGCYFNGSSFSVSGIGYEPLGSISGEKGEVYQKENLGDLKIFFLSGFLSSTGKITAPDQFHQNWYCLGDPTEAAFATLAMKAGFSLEEIESKYPLQKVYGFDSFRKRATIIRRHENKTIACVKGSLESILSVSDKIILNGEVIALSENQKQQIVSMSAAYSENALRVIAIAYKDLEKKEEFTIDEAESKLTFAGFVTMLDLPHPEVKEAIELVFKAGLKVFMITGDNEVTAKAIAKNIGLMNAGNEFPLVINGTKLTGMSDADLEHEFKNRAIIFSRVSPDDKFRIVDLLMKQGEIVAVTGDGVNDTLSLKRANIGVAMGRNGSKVAQEAANMILLDDNFSTLVIAVKEGRTIFRNIEKTIKINLSANIAELTCVLFGFAGAFFGVATPILAVQILLIDMVGEMFPLMMLTFDPPEKSIMQIPPANPKEKILTKEIMKGIVFSGIVMGILSYGAFLLTNNYSEAAFRQYEKSLTVTFISVNFCQYANLLSRRTYGWALGKYLFSNPNLIVAFVVSISCILMLVYVPFLNLYFHTAPLLLTDWIYPIMAGVICLLLFELRKLYVIKSQSL